jgi:hypothetical protein
MRYRGKLSVAATAVMSLIGLALSANDASAALIQVAGRKARLSASVKIATNTKGQRQILITIDPGVTTAFNVDVAYPENLVTPDFEPGVGAGGTFGALTPVTYLPPYGPTGGMGAPLIHAGVLNAISLVSNIQGQYPALSGGARPIANRSDGRSDLFTLTFNDNAPDRPRVFTVLGTGTDGSVDPALTPYVADNYLDAFVDDPTDPLDGQTLHFAGDQIEMLSIVVPADGRDASQAPGVPSVPLPAGVVGGLLAGGLVVARRTWGRSCE